MRIDIISIFPEYFSPLDVSLIGKARARGILDIRLHQLRDWTHDVHRTVDDTPYGGGPGMVMKPEPWGEAIDAVIADVPEGVQNAQSAQHGQSAEDAQHAQDAEGAEGAARRESAGEDGAAGRAAAPRLIVPTPSGRLFTQEMAVELAAEPWLLFACGRYEGIDARVMLEYGRRLRLDEVSIGDYVLAGGEVAALVMIEAIGRLLPGVLGNARSVADDSFAPGAMRNLLEGPVYTKPPVWRGHAVPEILLSGHHGKIAAWRHEQAVLRTARNRPDLAARNSASTS